MEENNNTDIEITVAEVEPGKEKLPKFTYAFFGIGLISLILYIIAINYTPFADFFNRNISSVIRGALASVTNVFPLSVVEMLIITLPVTLFLVIRFALDKYSDTWRNAGIFCLIILSIACILFSLFVCSFGIGYYASTLDKKLELEKSTVSKEELAATAEWLIAEVNGIIDEVEFKDKSSSVSPHTFIGTNDILLQSYDRISEKYPFIPRLFSRVKPILLSEPMTYTHISGVYTYFTGESNVNTNAPDYCIPYTMAHELAHQRGIAREDEANFVAFLVCAESDDAYIRYCAYLNLCEYVLNALYSADQKLWEATYKKLDNRAIYEMIAYNEFYEPYQDNIVGDISGAVNDAYLQANGTQGSVSYGLVVDLAVAYFHKNIEN